MPGSRSLIAATIASQADDPLIASYVAALRHRHGDATVAILLYGSYLRGQRDTLPDFYVILDRYRHALSGQGQALLNRLLPPNVYQIGNAASTTTAKYATVRLDQFTTAIAHDFHSYFWARFAQPCQLVYCRDDTIRSRILDTLAESARRFIAAVLPILPPEFDSTALWATGLRRTYGCELRTEPPDRVSRLFAAHGAYFTQITASLLREHFPSVASVGGDRYYCGQLSKRRRAFARAGWTVRRWLGKLLSVARLLKAALTFNAPLDYALWKIRRHSGVDMQPTERQRRYPLIFAWGLIWRIYRRGGFR